MLTSIHTFYDTLFSSLDLPRIILSGILFLAGFFIAPLTVRYQVPLLLRYPFWIMRMLEKHFSWEWNFIKTAAVIFSLNAFSLLLNILSGFGIIFPPLFAIFLGINVGIIVYVLSGWKGIFLSFINPVALLEFVAAWISLSLGFEIGEAIFFASFSLSRFYFSMTIYGVFILPLLLVACVIETAGIKMMRTRTGSDHHPQKHFT